MTTTITTNKLLLNQLTQMNLFINKLKPHISDFEENLKKNRKTASGRKRKYTYEEILKYIYLAMFVTSWSKLQLINPKDSKLIESSKKYFYKLTKYNYIEKIYIDALTDYDNKHKSVIFSIDSQTSKNINGTEQVDFGFKFKNKKSIKSSVIVDSNKVLYSLVNHKSSIHDVTVTEQVVNKMYVQKSTYHSQYYIAGDKGYVSETIKTKLKNDNIVYVVPKKENEKRNLIEVRKELNKLKKDTDKEIKNIKKGIKKLIKEISKYEKKVLKLKRQSKKDLYIKKITDINTLISEKENIVDNINKELRKKSNNINRKTRIQFTKKQQEALNLRYKVENYFSLINRRYKRIESFYNKREFYFKNFILLASLDILIDVS
jgi:hypothetical protein